MKTPFIPNAPVVLRGGLMVSNARLIDVHAAAAETSPFTGYIPDASKAFMEFDICHSLPNRLGPVGMGPGVNNYCGFFPDTLEVSHESLRFQQLNLDHLLKAYGSDDAPIHQDRIVGCIIATHFPNRPHTGWRLPGKPDGATACIKACAVIFKLASGVNRMLGNHLSSKQPQSVSIEVRSSFENLGVYVPSRDELVPLIDPTPEIFRAYKEVKGVTMPIVGKLKTETHPEGEQLIVTYGLNGKPVHFCGVGVTPTPAEAAAEIVRINASEGQTIGIAASHVWSALAGQKVTFRSGKRGRVEAVHCSGSVKLPGCSWSRTGTGEDPVLKIVLPDGSRVLRHYSELAGALHAG